MTLFDVMRSQHVLRSSYQSCRAQIHQEGYVFVVLASKLKETGEAKGGFVREERVVPGPMSSQRSVIREFQRAGALTRDLRGGAVSGRWHGCGYNAHLHNANCMVWTRSRNASFKHL